MLTLRASSKPICAPVQYEYYYSTRDGETVLIRRRIEQSRRHRHCETDASSSLNVNLTAGNRGRHHGDAEYRMRSRKKKKGISSRHEKRNRSHQSRGSRGDASHGEQTSIPKYEAREWKTTNDTSSKTLKAKVRVLRLRVKRARTRLRFGSVSPREDTMA